MNSLLAHGHSCFRRHTGVTKLHWMLTLPPSCRIVSLTYSKMHFPWWLWNRNKLGCKPVGSGSVQFSSVTPLCLTLCNPMNSSMPGLPVHHRLLEFTQTHVHRVSDAIQPSHPRSSPSPPAPKPYQYQSLFQWVNSLHEVAKVLEFQLQHQSFQWTPRTDL